MFFLKELWLPMLLSGALCFIFSALSWTVLPHHRFEWKRLPTEPDVLDALRKDLPPPGLYTFPYAAARELDRADVAAAFAKGPVGFMTITDRGRPQMAPMLVAMALFFLVVSFCIGYVAWIAAPASKLGVPFMHTLRVVFPMALLAYAAASLPESVWFGRPWGAWFAQLLDALVYATVTSLLFAWLWPA